MTTNHGGNVVSILEIVKDIQKQLSDLHLKIEQIQSSEKSHAELIVEELRKSQLSAPPTTINNYGTPSPNYANLRPALNMNRLDAPRNENPFLLDNN